MTWQSLPGGRVLVGVKVLDHSSPAALKTDLERHLDSVFQYEMAGPSNGGGDPMRWRFVRAKQLVGGIQIMNHQIDSHNADCCGGFGNVRQDFHLHDNRLWPWGHSGVVAISERVVSAGFLKPRSGSSSADDSQRNRLDKNLRGIFA